MQTSNKNTTDQISQVKQELIKYIRFWYLFLVTVVLAIGICFYLQKYNERKYTTESKIKVLDKSKGLELPTAGFVFKRSNINLDNEIELIKSYDVLKQVVDKTYINYIWTLKGTARDIQVDQSDLPFYFFPVERNQDVKGRSYRIKIQPNALTIHRKSDDKLLYEFEDYKTTSKTHDMSFDLALKKFNPKKFESVVGVEYTLDVIPLETATNRLKRDVKVEVTGRSSDVLKISYTSGNDKTAERTLDTLHKVIKDDGKADRDAILKQTIEFIDERFDSIQSELDSIEIRKQQFKVDNRFISPQTDLQRGVSLSVQSEEELFKVESQLNLLDFIKEQIETETEELSLVPNSFNSDGIEINLLISNYNDLILQRSRLVTSGGVNNPGVLRVNEELADLRVNILESVGASIAQLKLLKRQLENRDTSINEQFATLPEKERRFRNIEREQQIKETLYIFLMQKREEAKINRASIEEYFKVIETPLSREVVPTINSGNYLFVGLVAGLALPFGLLYLIFLLDTKLHGKEDVIGINPEIPIVGEIPDIKKAKESVFDNPNDRSILAEAFRILSSNVDFLLPLNDDGKGQVIFCTSTIKGEGKTYVSMNLSLAMSSINKKVLLIGADLRNPQLHTLIGEDKHKPGLSNYLHDLEFNWRDALMKGFERHQNHDIMLSGSIPPNPAHLLTNGRFTKLINEAKEDYDYVIVDTAPTILVTDTMLISKLADATIYIARANFTDKSLLKYSKELFETGKLKNMAYVINGVGASRSYGYSYNYGYGYGYGSQA